MEFIYQNKYKKLIFLFALIVYFYLPSALFSTGILSSIPQKKFPQLESLTVNDSLFKQFSEIVQQNYRNIAAKKDVEFQIYAYKVKENEDLLAIAARCSIPYETIATLNHIAYIDDNIVGKTVYLCTCPGVFVADNKKTQLDSILGVSDFEKYVKSCYNIEAEQFTFYENARLNATQRAFFTDSGFFSPIRNGVLSSPYGFRKSPFTGKKQFHQGIDIAVPEGAKVYACKSGTVQNVGYSSIYGNYIKLKHDGDKTSLYAHLSKVNVTEKEEVHGGDCIGLVGSTGLSTGSHLHFEIRFGTSSENPEDVSSRFKY
ncbi:MAG: hypothetical protein BKP49_08760 [Treponema sp. CETP13]|nr:MAG: hypothetical protein BKP49_08760 [Treponema sp. CETP13]